MAEKETTVGAEAGIHGRPAADLIKAAKQFSSRIELVKGGREVNAKSIMKVTGFARKGDKITVRAEGEDADEAVEAVANLIAAEEH